jgi:hypothetical protein
MHQWSIWVKGTTQDVKGKDYRLCHRCAKIQFRKSAKDQFDQS